MVEEGRYSGDLMGSWWALLLGTTVCSGLEGFWKEGGSSEKGPIETLTLLRNVVGGVAHGLGSGLQIQQGEVT